MKTCVYGEPHPAELRVRWTTQEMRQEWVYVGDHPDTGRPMVEREWVQAEPIRPQIEPQIEHVCRKHSGLVRRRMATLVLDVTPLVEG